ncbi:radical SAM protein [Thermodesulfobacteriota bacterium]
MTEYVKISKISQIPRIPLEGSLDITYRCNNNCRHCWISIPANSTEKENELTFDEIRKIVDDARKMGCRHWLISGGEPMLRDDFSEIFDYITRKSVSYSINTNGTLITPEIARLMKRKGTKMVALYGATAEVHDHITRNPGSFDAAMQGFAYLKEAQTGFIVQLIPMHDNFHQFKEMEKLARSLSRHYRVGAAWLYLSADGDLERNREIMRQRLDPKDIIKLDKPNLPYEDWREETESSTCCKSGKKDLLFFSCIATKRGFHLGPYGHMTFCSLIKDPVLHYDLKQGSFKECWEEFIPSLADKFRVTNEYKENCGSCGLRSDCRWCPVYGYLEHREYTSKVDYLCAVARENKNFKEEWKKEHRRFYQIAGITVQVDSDLPITDSTFHPKFKLFEVDAPGEDTITIRHHFSLPDLNGQDLGEEVYRKTPWAIYRKGNSWIYLGVSSDEEAKEFDRAVVFNNDHTRGRIYNNNIMTNTFSKGNLHSLTLLPTDQILLARVLADREGCYLHSSGLILEGKGLLFVGHSDAGKSTIATMLKDKAEILCDDRIIVRRWGKEFRLHGTWSHGDIPEVSPNSAPLKAILFLKQERENKLIILDNKRDIIHRLLACLIKPFVTTDWWEKMLAIAERLAHSVPCYNLNFDKTGKVVDILHHL